MASSTHASSLINSDADPRQAAQEIPLWQRRWRSFWGSYSSRIGLIVTVIIFLMALVPTSWLPYNPTEVNLAIANQPGAWAGEWSHPLGTDFLGRDMLSRTIHGARLTLIISGSAVILATVVGVLLGMVAGFYGHWIDEFISWLIDIQLAFPVIVLALAIIAILGGSLTSLIIVLAITSWATMARLVRGQILSARNEVYVEAAEAIGGRVLTPEELDDVLADMKARRDARPDAPADLPPGPPGFLPRSYRNGTPWDDEPDKLWLLTRRELAAMPHHQHLDDIFGKLRIVGDEELGTDTRFGLTAYGLRSSQLVAASHPEPTP